MLHLDKKDMKILYQLDINARQSNAQIGRKVGLSPEVVFHRIRNLEKKGVIEYFYTTIDPSKFGYKAYRIYVKTQDLTLEKEQEMIEWLVKNSKTWWVLSVEGRYDKDFFLWVKDDYEFEEEWRRFLAMFVKYIDNKLIQVYTHLHHFHRPYLINKPQDQEKENVIFSRSRVDVDDTDLKIMHILSNQAREPLVEISKTVKITPKNIAYRIRKLIKKEVILSFRAKLNLEEIGYRDYKVEINLNNYKRINDLYVFAKLHPNITYINQVIGLADFDADIEVQNEEELDRVIAQIRKKFDEDIRDISYLTIKNIHKIAYFPSGALSRQQ